MPKLAFALLMLATICGPASSMQRRPALYLDAAHSHFPTEHTQCLTRKSTGEVECRTAQQWRKLAAKMDRDAVKKPR
jgi:hypothetical protein